MTAKFELRQIVKTRMKGQLIRVVAKKKVWKMNFFPGQGKVREFLYESGKFRKKFKKSGKSQGISNYP